jgi:hypothetical protein
MLGRAGSGLAAARLAVSGIARCRCELRRDEERVARSAPPAIDTPLARLESAQAGHRPPVMVVHGVLGGFDFGVGFRRVTVIAKPVVWVALLSWPSGLAVWESNWRTARVRRIAVALVALALVVFWSSVTFGGG